MADSPLPPVVRKLFERFCEAAGRPSFDETDWSNFYRLAKACSSQRYLRKPISDYASLFLNEGGFTVEKAGELETLMYHLMKYSETN